MRIRCAKNRPYLLAFALVLCFATDAATHSNKRCIELVSGLSVALNSKAPGSIKYSGPAVFDAAELRRHLYAVHATDLFPKNGVMKVGGNEPPSFRPDIHWAIGTLVFPHAAVGDMEITSWDRSQYAIIVPVKALEPQLSNLFIHDTVTIGDLKLPRGTVIVMPENDSTVLPVGITAFKYKRRGQGTLRKAVERALDSLDGWKIAAEDGVTTGADKDQLFLSGISTTNIHTPDFFSPILIDHPNVSATIHEATSMGQIDRLLSGLASLYHGGNYEVATPRLRLTRDVLLLNIKHLKDELPWETLPPKSKQAVEKAMSRLTGYLNVLDVELMFRDKFGKAGFRDTDDYGANISKEIFARQKDRPALEKLYREHLGELRDSLDRSMRTDFPPVVTPETLAHFNLQDVSALAKKHPDLGNEASVIDQYATARIRYFSAYLDDTELKRLIDITASRLAAIDQFGLSPYRKPGDTSRETNLVNYHLGNMLSNSEAQNWRIAYFLLQHKEIRDAMPRDSYGYLYDLADRYPARR